MAYDERDLERALRVFWNGSAYQELDSGVIYDESDLVRIIPMRWNGSTGWVDLDNADAVYSEGDLVRVILTEYDPGEGGWVPVEVPFGGGGNAGMLFRLKEGGAVLAAEAAQVIGLTETT